MTSLASDSLARLHRATATMDEAFRVTTSSADRAARLAAMVRTLWPTTSISACIIHTGSGPVAAVLDAADQPRTDLAEVLLAEGPADAPGELTLAQQRLFIEPAISGERALGALAVATPGDGDAAAGPELRAGLAACARHLALHLALDELHERLAEEAALASIGELAGPVVHEFNNLLNTMLLQVAVMEQKVDASLLPDLQTIRRQGATVTTLVKQWQQCRRRPPNAAQPVQDVNWIVEDVVAEIRRQRPDSPDAVTLNLSPGLPPVRGAAAELRRLVLFQLNNALAVSPEGVGVTTEVAGGAVVLRVEDFGPPVPSTALPRYFEPLGDGRAGMNRLELAACRTLVRRLQGKLRAEDRPAGGVSVVVELPAERS
jgi:signal transduction histidine kinase